MRITKSILIINVRDEEYVKRIYCGIEE